MAVAIHAANLRVTHRLKPQNALIAGTAMAIDADAIVTNDASWPSTLPKHVLRLNEFV